MRKILAISVTVGAVMAVAPVAYATTHTASGYTNDRCNADWDVNPDETSRKPVQKLGGMEFSGSDLIHHTTSLDVNDLKPGSYFASPSPDQPSFFSVEVYGSDGGYATLRWDHSAHKWTMVTGGQLYSNTSPAALVDMVTPHKSHTVVSFGVGYTANPPGTVTTLVTSVRFNGQRYWLGCKPHHPKPTPTPTDTGTPTPTPTPTESTPPGEAPVPTPVNSDLPVTG